MSDLRRSRRLRSLANDLLRSLANGAAIDRQTSTVPPVVLDPKERPMMRHECDRCRREIETENEVWYAVRIEALPHASVLASDDDRDHLMEVVEQLDAIEAVEGGFVTDYSPLEATYDLCAECYEKFRKSPLGAEPATLGFSRN